MEQVRSGFAVEYRSFTAKALPFVTFADIGYFERAARAPRWGGAPREISKRKSLTSDGLRSVNGPEKSRGA